MPAEASQEVKSPGSSLEHPQAPSGSSDRTNFVLARQKSRCRDRRESRMFLVDGQLCWNDDAGGGPAGSRRHSSVGLMFGSSMDLTGIGQSMDSGAGSGSDEAVSYRIKWCRDNIARLKQQAWPMEKKLQMLRASKMFIKQHQGELNQSKQAKDMIAGTNAIFERYWRHFKREFANFLVIITPWEMRIKKIESHFGSVVASYFTFLRWIFWLNLANSLVMVAFVIIPELIENDPDLTGMRRGPLGMQRASDGNGREAPKPEFNPTLNDLWEFEGFLKFSPIFYGYYSNAAISLSGFWRKPLAYLLSAMLTYLFCFVCISRKLSQNTKLSRIGTKEDEYAFCWTVFVGWDFMIGNSETAYNKTSSLVMNLKEGILEEKEQKKDRNWRLIVLRIVANLMTIILLGTSAYVVTLAVQRSENLPQDAGFFQKNELQFVLLGIQHTFPPLFDYIGYMETYHPRKALNWQLGRILCLDFLNFYSLMFSLFDTVEEKARKLDEVANNIILLRKNETYYRNLFTTSTSTSTSTTSTTTTTTTTSTSAPLLLNASTPTSLVTNFSLTATNVSPLEPSVTSAGGLNASSVMTSVLLASSTMVTPTTSSPLTSFVTTATMTIVDASTLFTPAPPFSALTPPAAETAQPPTATMSPGDFSTDWPTEAISPASVEPKAESTPAGGGQDESDDYPDLVELLRADSKPGARPQRGLRAKRAAAADRKLTTRRATRRRAKASRKTTEAEPSLAASGAEQPLEGRLPARADQVEREEDSARASREPGAGRGAAATGRPAARSREMDGQAGSDDYESDHESGAAAEQEEEEEEPIEGRLVPPKAAGSRYLTRRPARARRPRIEPKPGELAAARQPALLGQGNSPSRLDDDLNSDLIERASLGEPVFVAASTESLSEVGHGEPGGAPTGAAPKLAASPSGAEYSAPRPPGWKQPSAATTETSSNQGQLQQQSPVLGRSGLPDIVQAESPLESPIEPPIEPPIVTGDNGQYVASTFAPVADSSTALGNDDQRTAPIATTTTTAGTTCRPPASTIESTEAPILVSTVLANGSLATVPLAIPGKKSGASTGSNASEATYTDCIETPDFKHQEIAALNENVTQELQSLCWETAFGQEMVKTVIMDLALTVLSAVTYELGRALFVRYCNRFFFWDLERGQPGYQDFKLAENVLHLVNNQSTVWMGMFFAPALPAINTVKLAVIMYIRSWAVLTCTIPHETVFKVSKSNNFYYWILLINLLVCILPVAYSVTWIRPSWHCGPFGGECRMYLVVTKLVKSLLPPEANSAFKYLTSPGAVIPILIALILIIYYLASTVSSSKEANKELKAQLKKEKEQESAVPEITSTAATAALEPAPNLAPVASAARPTPAGGLLPTLAATAASAASAASAAAAAAPATLDPNALAAKQVARAQVEHRPRTLLVPPPT